MSSKLASYQQVKAKTPNGFAPKGYI